MFAGNRLKTKLFTVVALLSLLAAVFLPMSAFAAEAEDAVEPSVPGDSPAAIQADALQPVQDGEGVANTEPLGVSGEGGGETAPDSAGEPAEGGAGADAIETEGSMLDASESGDGAESSVEASSEEEAEIEPIGTAETPGNSKKAGDGEGGSDGAAMCAVTVSANPSAGGTVGGGGEYAIGDLATVTATASEYYTFVGWFEDEEQMSADVSYTFTVAGSRTLIAVFDLQEYEVVEGGGHSTGSANGNETATLITGGVLNGAAIRLRPQGSYRQVTVQNDGIGGELYVQLFDIRATSRLELIQVEDSDDCYYISYYETYYDTEPHYNKYYYLRPYKDETLGTIRVNTLINSNSCEWKLYRLNDGTYWIKNADSGLYLSLMELGNINKYEGTLVQRGTRVKWEIEFVRGPQKGNAPRNDLKDYDSYTFEYVDGDSSVTVTSANWMSCLPDEAYLADLSIPGVHDAGTVNVGGDFQGPSTEEDNSWKCQQLYIDDMLTNGVRYFDLRLAENNDILDAGAGSEIRVQHGDTIWGICEARDDDTLTVDTVMKWVTSFLKAHPGETVILAIRDEDGDSSDAIYNWFNKYRQEHDNIYVGDGNPQLKDVRGKIVLISRIDEKDKHGNVIRPYHKVPDDFSSPAWAIYVDWFRGEDYAPKLAASTGAYEFWTQDYYHITVDEKWKWIEECILGDGPTSAKGLHDQAVSQGKGAWVVNFTSTERLGTGEYPRFPVQCARNINNRLKQADKFGTEADEYVGIVCVDFIDEQLAQRIYAINFRYALVRQEVTFSSPMQVKVYGEEPFRFEASTTGDGAISYTTSNPSVATVDDSGRVTIHGAGTAIITATAAATGSYMESSGSYSLFVNRAVIAVSAESQDYLYYGSPIELSLVIVEGSLKYDDQIDSLGIEMTTTATDTSDVGEYPISLSYDFSNPYSNYYVAFVPSTLTINPRPLGVEVADGEATYNGSWQYGEAEYSFTSLQYLALLEGHTATIAYTPSRGVDASEAAYDNGEFGHDFRVVDENGVDRTSNYILTSAVPGKLTIKPAKATITVSSASKVEGEADPAFTGTVEGLMSEDDFGEVTYTRVNDDEEPGTYRGVLTATYTANPNYDVKVVNGDFTIMASSYSVSFDANVPASASTTCSGSMDDERFAYDEKKALSENGYSLPGYNFEGWNTKADGTGTAYADKAEVQNLSDNGGTVTLYARWSGKPYTIVYEPGEIGGPQHVQTAYFDRPGKLDVYSDRAFGWNSGGKTLHGWSGSGFGSFYGDGGDFVNLCGAPDAGGNVSDPVIVADWVNNGQIVVTVTKDGAPQEGLKDCFELVQGGTMFRVSVEYQNGRYVFDPSQASGPGTVSAQLPPGEYDLRFDASGYPKATARITYGDAHAVSVVFAYHTVTYKVVGGAWADHTTTDKTEVVLSGASPADVPTGMVAEEGFTGGMWDAEPGSAAIVNPATFTYTFDAELEVHGIIEWDDGNDERGERPEKVTVHLLANGERSTSMEVSEDAYGLWAFSFDKLPPFDSQRREIAYFVTADEVPEYTVEVGPSGDNAFRITYSLEEHTVAVEGGTADKATAHVGDTVTITADTPESGKAFVQWEQVDGVDYGNASSTSTTFTMPAKDVTATAVFAPIVIGPIGDKVYTGEPIEPTDEVKVSWSGVDFVLTADDYEVSFDDNVDAGTATVTVTMKGPRAGSATATFEIAKRLATITVDSASKVQGEADPAFTGTVEGLMSEDDLGEVTYTRVNDDEEPGTYRGVLTATYTVNPNYDVSVVKGDFTIKKQLIVTWLDGNGSVLQTKTYGEGDEPPAYDGKEPTKAATAQYTYAFTGWDDGTVDNTTTTYRSLFDAAVNSYGISLDLAGGTLDGQDGIVVWDIAYGSMIILPKPVREGYTFLYWEGSRYDAGDKYLVEGAHAFTAKWERNTDNTPSSYDDGGVPGGTAKATMPATGDGNSALVLMLSIAAIGSLCAIAASAIRRRRDS